MRWLFRRPQPRRVDPIVMELETAKEILREVFDVRPRDVDEMIWAKVVERRELWPSY